MNAKTRNYVQEMINNLEELIENTEPQIIKKKVEVFLDIKDNNKKIIKIIKEEQIEVLKKFIRHIRNFEKHKQLIIHEVFGDLVEKMKTDEEIKFQYNKFQNFLLKEDELFKFLLNHFSKYMGLFEKQIKLIKNEGRKPIFQNVPILNNLLKEKSFIELLEEEEMYYYELLELNNAHLLKLREYGHDLEYFESYEIIKNNIKKVATIITTLPLGPLEAISGVLWISYFGAEKIEKHLRNYKIWENTRKAQITKLVESLAPKNKDILTA